MGDGASPADVLKRQFVQRSLATATTPAASSFDPLSPEALAARQRAALGIQTNRNSAYGTSTRGTESAKGTGLQGPQDDPIINMPAVTDQQGSNAVDNTFAKQAAAQAAQDVRDRNGPVQKPGGPKTYRF